MPNCSRFRFEFKDFGYIKKEFLNRFRNDLSEQCKKDIDTVYGIRNAIGHSYVSLARNYFLYRPGSRKKLNEYKKAFNRGTSSEDAAKPIVYKFDFSNDEIYLPNFAAIQRLDEVSLNQIAINLGVTHSRIR